MKTHIVIDLTYTPEEGQECFVGTHKECLDFISEQSDYFMYKAIPMTESEYNYYNSPNEPR